MEITELRRLVVGIDTQVPVRDGRRIPYTNFDNAASTPAIKPVIEEVQNFLPWYASVHRGDGYKSQVSTALYDRAHAIIGDFFHYDPAHHLVVLGKNATEALNKAAYRIPIPNGKAVLTTLMEHHSNDLPWRYRAPVRFAPLTPDGELDLDAVEKMLRSGTISLLTVCGASNVTGIINPLKKLAELAHIHGALFVVDAAQLAPHAPLYLSRADNNWNGPDLIAISGHKLYAPFGTGALIGPKDLFRYGIPEYLGGGTVVSVSTRDVVFAEPPEREEAGSPNVLGALALAAALKWLKEQGMDNLYQQEHKLTAYTYRQLQEIPGCTVYGPPPEKVPRVGVLTFNLDGLPHGLVAAALSHEAGIGVRHGCFCARPYVHHLLGLTAEDHRRLAADVQHRRFDRLPGMVRASFGFYNTYEEVDYFIAALKYLTESRTQLLKEYVVDPQSGHYQFKPQFRSNASSIAVK